MTGLIISAIIYIYAKQNLVCSVKRMVWSEADSSLHRVQMEIVTGTTLREDKKTEKTIKMNSDRNSKVDLFKYIGTYDPQKIWTEDSIQNSTNLLIGTYLILIALLVALITHLTEEIILNKRLSQLEKERHVFISYNHQESEVANTINARLQKAKIKTIFDSKDMQAMDKIEDFIFNSIKNSRITLSLVSTKSLLSGWVGVESVNTLFLEKFDEQRSFIACYLDDDFLKPGFTNEGFKIIDKELEKIRLVAEERDQFSDTRDLNPNKTRLLTLRKNLDLIIERLQNELCVDMRKEKFEENFPKLLELIRSKLKN